VRIDKDSQIRLLENLSKSSTAKAKNDADAAAAQKTKNVTDKVELSSMKEEVNRLKEKAKAVPDVRPEKVAEMQQALQNNTYNPKGELVARKIIQNHLLDEIF
jgi:flagellar biosynthesis anti-sigma factor FlgM